MIIFAPSEEKIKQAVEYVAPLVEPFKNIKPKRRIKKKSSNQTGSKSRFLKEDPNKGNLLRGIVNCSVSGLICGTTYKDQNSPFDNSFSTAVLR